MTQDRQSDQQKRDTLLQATDDNKDNHSAILIHVKSVEGEPVIYDEEGDEATDEVENFTDTITDEGVKLGSPVMPSASPKRSSGRGWLLALAVVIIAMAAAFLLMRNCTHQDEPAEPPANVQPVPAPANNDVPSWKIERHSATKHASDSNKTGQ